MIASMIPHYLEKRMQEMGFCNGYAMRVKHFVIPAKEVVRVAAFNEIFILLENAADVSIESDLGVFNTTGTEGTAQQQHEHSGQITITNLTRDATCHVQFVQAIPLDKTEELCNPCKD